MKKYIVIAVAIIIFTICGVGMIYIINKLDKQNENPETDKLGEAISTYNNPIIPNGFKKVETESASWELENGIPKGWNNGLVIEDEIGNQFVWVPNVKITDENLIKLYEYTEQDQDAEQKNEQLKEYNTQIEKYGGFYISRYEAGITYSMQKNTKEFSSITNDIEGTPVSKQGQIIWNYISLKNAKKNAENMYNNVEIRSDLMSPIQWLNIMQWISNNGYNIKNAEKWGNFSNANFRITGWYSEDYGKTYKYGEDILKAQYNMILSSGATERNKSNNIYDLAGNVMEYTDGWVRNRGYYSVGGHYDTTGDYGISEYRLIGVIPLEKLGFRIVLYNNK